MEENGAHVVPGIPAMLLDWPARGVHSDLLPLFLPTEWSEPVRNVVSSSSGKRRRLNRSSALIAAHAAGVDLERCQGSEEEWGTLGWLRDLLRTAVSDPIAKGALESLDPLRSSDVACPTAVLQCRTCGESIVARAVLSHIQRCEKISNEKKTLAFTREQFAADVASKNPASNERWHLSLSVAMGLVRPVRPGPIPPFRVQRAEKPKVSPLDPRNAHDDVRNGVRHSAPTAAGQEDAAGRALERTPAAAEERTAARTSPGAQDVGASYRITDQTVDPSTKANISARNTLDTGILRSAEGIAHRSAPTLASGKITPSAEPSARPLSEVSRGGPATPRNLLQSELNENATSRAVHFLRSLLSHQMLDEKSAAKLKHLLELHLEVSSKMRTRSITLALPVAELRQKGPSLVRTWNPAAAESLLGSVVGDIDAAACIAESKQCRRISGASMLLASSSGPSGTGLGPSGGRAPSATAYRHYNTEHFPYTAPGPSSLAAPGDSLARSSLHSPPAGSYGTATMRGLSGGGSAPVVPGAGQSRLTGTLRRTPEDSQWSSSRAYANSDDNGVSRGMQYTNEPQGPRSLHSGAGEPGRSTEAIARWYAGPTANPGTPSSASFSVLRGNGPLRQPSTATARSSGQEHRLPRANYPSTTQREHAGSLQLSSEHDVTHERASQERAFKALVLSHRNNGDVSAGPLRREQSDEIDHAILRGSKRKIIPEVEDVMLGAAAHSLPASMREGYRPSPAERGVGTGWAPSSTPAAPRSSRPSGAMEMHHAGDRRAVLPHSSLNQDSLAAEVVAAARSVMLNEYNATNNPRAVHHNAKFGAEGVIATQSPAKRETELAVTDSVRAQVGEGDAQSLDTPSHNAIRNGGDERRSQSPPPSESARPPAVEVTEALGTLVPYRQREDPGDTAGPAKTTAVDDANVDKDTSNGEEFPYSLSLTDNLI